MTFGWFDTRREAAAVVEANFLGEGLGFVDGQLLECPRQQRAEEVVAPGWEVQGVIELGAVVLLRRAPRGTGAVGSPDRNHQVAAGRELLEVMPGDIGVQFEPFGNLARGDARAGISDEEVDVAPGGIAKGVRDRGDGRTE